MDVRVEFRWIAAAAVAVAVAAGAWLLSKDDDEPVAAGAGAGKTLAATPQVSELKALAEGTGHEVYWVGREGGVAYEWTELPSGEAYVRYLTDEAEAGDPSPSFLTVGTYPVGDGLEAIANAAKEDGAETFKAPGGGTALVSEGAPSSVYVAYPGSAYQVEVYHPDPAEARELVESGAVDRLG